tara:strand:+ start:3025 stop:3939 length:915 start_codon:yes stop_codon:yes gene_type:complete
MLRKKFENDIKNELYRVSQNSRFRISQKKDLYRTLLDFLSIRKKTIKSLKREVKFNPELIKELILSPDKEKTKAIKHISNVAAQGGNLNIFQSPKIKQTNFFDHFSNEWNIFHFHLSNKINPKTGFVKQGNTILFTYINDDTIIFLGTDKHRIGVFAEKKWLNIVYDHFEYILKPYESKGTQDVYPDIEGQALQTMWDKGYSPFMRKIRDKVYIGPGLGRTTSGHSLVVVQEANKIMRWLNTIIKQIEESRIEVSQYLKIDNENLALRIIIGEKGFELIEENINLKLLSYPEQLVSKDELRKMY